MRGRGRGSQHPTAQTANPSPARNASTRAPRSPPQPSRAARRSPASSVGAGRPAMERGGASGRPGLPETSASGAAAFALPGSVGSSSCVRDRSPDPRSRSPSPSSRTPSPRSRTPALYCPPSQPVMLEHLSSLPTQMVRCGPPWPQQARRSRSSPRAKPTSCVAIPGPKVYLALFPDLCFLGSSSLPPRESPASTPLGCFSSPGKPSISFLAQVLGGPPDDGCAVPKL